MLLLCGNTAEVFAKKTIRIFSFMEADRLCFYLNFIAKR